MIGGSGHHHQSMEQRNKRDGDSQRSSTTAAASDAKRLRSTATTAAAVHRDDGGSTTYSTSTSMDPLHPSPSSSSCAFGGKRSSPPKPWQGWLGVWEGVHNSRRKTNLLGTYPGSSPRIRQRQQQGSNIEAAGPVETKSRSKEKPIPSAGSGGTVVTASTGTATTASMTTVSTLPPPPPSSSLLGAGSVIPSIQQLHLQQQQQQQQQQNPGAAVNTNNNVVIPPQQDVTMTSSSCSVSEVTPASGINSTAGKGSRTTQASGPWGVPAAPPTQQQQQQSFSSNKTSAFTPFMASTMPPPQSRGLGLGGAGGAGGFFGSAPQPPPSPGKINQTIPRTGAFGSSVAPPAAAVNPQQQQKQQKIPAAKSTATPPNKPSKVPLPSQPKGALHATYGKPPRRKVISNAEYYTWHDGGPPHELKWTSVFCCPLTGEVFPSARFGQSDTYQVRPPDNSVWYSKKANSEHAAAARAYDCLALRAGSGAPQLADDPPYTADKAMPLPPSIPDPFRQKIEEVQKSCKQRQQQAATGGQTKL